jgi:hypothetical protein
MTETIDANISVIPDEPVQQSVLYFPVGNDVTVVVQYPNIADGTGTQSEFYYKQNRATSDTDPTTVVYASPVVADPDNAGATMSRFIIDSEDNSVAGAFWWRIDFVDTSSSRTTVGFGTLLVEAV